MDGGGGGSGAGKEGLIGSSSIGGSGQLRESFIVAANSVTALYKKSEKLEREAKVQGAKLAFTAVLEFALGKGRTNGAHSSVSAIELLEFCRAEMSKMNGTGGVGGSTGGELGMGPVPPWNGSCCLRTAADSDGTMMERKLGGARKRPRHEGDSDTVMDLSGSSTPPFTSRMNSFDHPYDRNDDHASNSAADAPSICGVKR
mmetsp:Transcript_6793/g.13865  ORF Transcript_6793/g.13865 Transcript_6793/m.13865 type:complete len:201 (-) Transcript_6793:602-1204(-)